MTKAELEQENSRLKERLEDLESELNSMDDDYYEMESQLNDAIYSLEGLNAIWDVDDFKHRLMADNLLTLELEDFIVNYIKFGNKRPD